MTLDEAIKHLTDRLDRMGWAVYARQQPKWNRTDEVAVRILLVAAMRDPRVVAAEKDDEEHV